MSETKKTIVLNDDQGNCMCTINLVISDKLDMRELANLLDDAIKQTKRALLEAALQNEVKQLDEGGAGK